MPRAKASVEREQPLCGVIADDLTGALDAAAAFAVAGFPASLLLDRRTACKDPVIVLTTDSRHDTPVVARVKTQRAVQAMLRRNACLIYKKIDSTCQGNLAIEVEAALDATGISTAVICPANISQRRVVRQGVLHVCGEPRLNVVDLLGSQLAHVVMSIRAPLSDKKLRQAVSGQHRFVIADATDESDLRCLARLVFPQSRVVLLVGSAGLAATVARLLADHQQITHAAPRPPSVDRVSSGRQRDVSNELPVILFIGSRNELTQRQVKALMKASATTVVDCSRAGADEAGRALKGSRHTLVEVPVHQKPNVVIENALSHFGRIIRANRIGGLVLSGGDTARHVCRCVTPRAIAVRGELLPGLAWGRFVGGSADGVAVCTKPGGFGEEDSLLRAVQMLMTISEKQDDE